MAGNRKAPPQGGGKASGGKRSPEPWEIEFDDDLDDSQPTQTRERPGAITDTPEGRSWRTAASIVNKLRPVPRLVWPIVHSVFGKAGEIGRPDGMMFSTVGPVVQRAAKDKTLAPLAKDEDNLNLSQSVNLIGHDVAAAVCLVHSVCRRIYTVMPERVARPIIDDALLRTHLGFYIGSLSPEAGAGRGMLAGFAGRCGLAVQIAAGDNDQAQRALTGLASGKDMSQVCSSVYGCDPLEVAALALISGGCSREIAFGIASYSTKSQEAVPGSEQYRWLALFTVTESLRMGNIESVPETLWTALKYDRAGRDQLGKQIIASQRRGHGWQWMTQTLMGAGGEPPKEPKAKGGAAAEE